jgi:two-component system sensor histidine kinase UhpB
MHRMPLLWRVFLINACLMVGAVLVLLFSPATVSFPVAEHEVVVAVLGLLCLLAIDLVLLRSYMTPLQELTTTMAQVDLLEPGARVHASTATPEVRVVGEAFNRMLERLEEDRRLGAEGALAAQERERLRVSRELHDGVGQRLTGALLRLQSVEGRVPADVRADLTEIRAEVRSSLEDVRETARRLRPEALEQLGLTSALVALCRDLGGASGVSITRHLTGRDDDLGEEMEVAIYRVAQESLTNVVRHAEANQAIVTLARRNGELVLSVIDDGRGFDVEAVTPGVGLTGMRERALLAGARLKIVSRPGDGTEVRLVVDLDGRA